MLKKDQDYILWIVKRLVYKYNEDPKLILNIESILDKNQTELNFYRNTHCSINNEINNAINNLNKIKTSYLTSIKNTQKEYEQNILHKKNTTFEELDINKLLKQS